MINRWHPHYAHILLFLVFASGLGWFINSYPPEGFVAFAIFYTLLATTAFFLFQSIFCAFERAVFLSIGIVVLFLLWSFNLRHPLYTFLLLALIISINLSLSAIRKKRR